MLAILLHQTNTSQIKSMKNKDERHTSKEKAELEFLSRMDADKINVREIPEMLDWSGARRGVFYKPVK